MDYSDLSLESKFPSQLVSKRSTWLPMETVTPNLSSFDRIMSCMDEIKMILKNQLGSHHSIQISKRNFPRFDGRKLSEWLHNCEQFFLLNNTPPESKVHLASLHFEGLALQWHMHYMNLRYDIYPFWTQYVSDLILRFGNTIEDPRYSVHKKQADKVQSYMGDIGFSSTQIRVEPFKEKHNPLADPGESFCELKQSLNVAIKEQNDAPEDEPSEAAADAVEEDLISEIDNAIADHLQTLNDDFVADPVFEIVDEQKDVDPPPISVPAHAAISPSCFEIHSSTRFSLPFLEPKIAEIFRRRVGNFAPFSVEDAHGSSSHSSNHGWRPKLFLCLLGDAASSSAAGAPLPDTSPYDPGPSRFSVDVTEDTRKGASRLFEQLCLQDFSCLDEWSLLDSGFLFQQFSKVDFLHTSTIRIKFSVIGVPFDGSATFDSENWLQLVDTLPHAYSSVALVDTLFHLASLGVLSRQLVIDFFVEATHCYIAVLMPSLNLSLLVNTSKVSAASHLNNVELKWKFASGGPLWFKGAFNHMNLFYIEDKDVDLKDVIEDSLPKAPLAIVVTCLLFAIEGMPPAISENALLEVISVPSDVNKYEQKDDNLPFEIRLPVKHGLSRELQFDFDKVADLALNLNAVRFYAAEVVIARITGEHQMGLFSLHLVYVEALDTVIKDWLWSVEHNLHNPFYVTSQEWHILQLQFDSIAQIYLIITLQEAVFVTGHSLPMPCIPDLKWEYSMAIFHRKTIDRGQIHATFNFDLIELLYEEIALIGFGTANMFDPMEAVLSNMLKHTKCKHAVWNILFQLQASMLKPTACVNFSEMHQFLLVSQLKVYQVPTSTIAYMVVLHRKMIDRGRFLIPLVLLKWRDLPPKHGTWKFSDDFTIIVATLAIPLVHQPFRHQLTPEKDLDPLYTFLVVVPPELRHATGALVNDNLFTQQLNGFQSGSSGDNDHFKKFIPFHP